MDAFAFNIEANQETTTTSVFQHLQTRTALTSGDLGDIKNMLLYGKVEPGPQFRGKISPSPHSEIGCQAPTMAGIL